MNPLLTNKKDIILYTIVVTAFAAVYAVVFGLSAGMNPGSIIIDTAVYGFLFGLEGFILWSILNYAVPAKGFLTVRILVMVIMAIMVVGSITGIEALVMYGYMKSGFADFAATIPQRMLVSLMLFVIFVLLYGNRREKEEREEAVSKIPLPARPAAPCPDDVIERITIRGGKNIKVIALDEIEFLQAEGDYVAIITAQGRWLKEQTMKYFEEHLPADSFVRVHRSYIVNLSKISRLERYGNLYQVALHSGGSLRVSVTGYKLLKQQLNL